MAGKFFIQYLTAKVKEALSGGRGRGRPLISTFPHKTMIRMFCPLAPSFSLLVLNYALVSWIFNQVSYRIIQE